MSAGARVVIDCPPVPVLWDDGVLGLAVVRVIPLVVPVVAREPDDGLRVAHIAILLFPGVAGVEVPLEVFRVTNDTVSVVLFVRQGSQGAIVEVVSRSAVVESERLMRPRLAADVGEAVGGQRAAAAAPRALRPARGALAARHEENARRGVKL